MLFSIIMGKFNKRSRLLQLNLEEIDAKIDELRKVFTERQIELIKNKAAGKELTASEKVFYSKSINKKFKAFAAIFNKDKEDYLGKYFVYGEEDILHERRKKAIALLKKLERNHKAMEMLISGGFLWKENYNDIDIFIISKYEKEDRIEGEFHYNYILPEEKDTLFFQSLSKLCVTNFNIIKNHQKSRRIDINILISNYQELLGDIGQKWVGYKQTLRTFLVNAVFISEGVILNSKQLDFMVEKIISNPKKLTILRKIFVGALLTGYSQKLFEEKIKELKKGYEELEKEYGKSKFYEELIKSYDEVLAVEI